MKKNVKFSDIAGYEREVKDLKEIATLMKNRIKGEDVPLPKGLLLSGESGMGKTMMAKALICESGATCVEIEMKDRKVGVKELRDGFAKARACAPSIIFIDGMDKKFVSASRIHQNVDVLELRNALNSELSGIEECDDILVIGTANNVESLSGIFTRAGRFDRCINICPPKIVGRMALLKKFVEGKKIGENLPTLNIVKAMSGCSCAEIKSMVNEASIYAIDNGGVMLRDHFFKGIDRIKYKTLSCLDGVSDEEKRIMATHEAGHLVVALYEMPDFVKTVSINSRDDIGGYLDIGNEETNLVPLSLFEKLISVLLAGLVAEEVVFKDRFTGSVDDLEKSKQLTRDLLVEHSYYGLEFLGEYEGDGFLSGQLSEESKFRNEQKIIKILKERYNRAEGLVRTRRDLIDIFTNQLLEKITLQKEDILQIFENYQNGVCA